MVATCTEVSIMEDHIYQKARKAAKEAEKHSGKIRKALDKYKGTVIPEEKEVLEIQGVIRSFAILCGKPADLILPTDITSLLELSQEIESEYHDILKKGDIPRSSVFMKQPVNGDKNNLWPVISSHMVIGNLKENLKIIVNNGDKSILKSKVSVGETFALDVKPIEDFMIPDQDINKDENGVRILLERPIQFKDSFGNTVTAISSSETLPAGTKFECTLRCRKGSPIDEAALRKLLDFGKNNGLGAWRGSGHKGSYNYKLDRLRGYKEVFEDGWL
jgi:hypothetical protein